MDLTPSQTFPSWATKVVTTAVGTFGLGGIFYGAGFLVMRSHFSFIGIWGGVPLSNSQIAEEGGRFFFQTIIAPASLLASPARTGYMNLLALVIFAVSIDLAKKLSDSPLAGRLRKGVSLLPGIPTTVAAIFVVASMILLETNWVVVHDIPPARTGLYAEVVIRAMVAVAIAWLLYRRFWPRLTATGRTLVVGQWILTIAAVSLLPVVFGRLAMPTSFPTFSTSHICENSELLLVGETSTSWIVWNNQLKQTELIPRDDKERVVIGRKKLVLQ